MATKDTSPWCSAAGLKGLGGTGSCICLGDTGGASHTVSEGQSLALSRAVCLQIREDIDHYGIRLYQFPECDSDEDEEFKLQDQALKVGLVPTAPFLEGQSSKARRRCQPGVPLALSGAMQALQQSHVMGSVPVALLGCITKTPHFATCSLVGWGRGAANPLLQLLPSHLGLSVARALRYLGKWVLGYLGKWVLDTAEKHVEGCGL